MTSTGHTPEPGQPSGPAAENSDGPQAAADEVPWGELTPEETAAYYQHQADLADYGNHVPARSPEQRAAYDDIEQARAEAAEIEAEREHFNGWPGALETPHERFCEFGCTYDTPGQAQERAEMFCRAEESYEAGRELEAGS